MNHQQQYAGENDYETHSKFHPDFVALSSERRTHVNTACAAFHLGRKPQTLRVWASYEKGPLRPVRVNGRLAWSVAEIRRVLQS
jgi:hypothetical protein